MDLLPSYLNKLSRLKRATTYNVKAPHQPILLLSIIQSIACGEIVENRIEITSELVARFKDNWSLLVHDNFFQPRFALPFYHLVKNSGNFWHLQTIPGKEILLTSSFSVTSFAQLKEAVAYAYFDEALFALLTVPETRDILYSFLLEQYFPNIQIKNIQLSLFEKYAGQILHDTSAVYKKEIENADEEEIFIRCGVFKKVVPQIYDNACSISGMRIISGYNIQMIDACHIVPFAMSHDDTISNGISLSPNLHRAFDRGLLAIDDDYKVIISSGFTEDISPNSLKMFEGKRIQLPSKENYRPLIDNLRWHRKEIFKA